MRTIQLDLLFTVLVALVVFFTGRALTARSAFLQRFSIPAPVVGGVLVAILLALADGFGGVRISFDMSLRDNLLLMFFTTVGLSADARMLVKGGPKLITFLIVSIAFIVGAIVHSASAQDCERFAFACQGWNGTRSSPLTSPLPFF